MQGWLRAGVVLSAVLGCGAARAVPTQAECQSRVNDTPARLLACIQQKSLWQHLARFQRIADANPDAHGHGNRDTGTLGYAASVNYVAELMRSAGYRATVQPYPYSFPEPAGTPEFSAGGRAYVPGRDWFPAPLSGAGDVTGAVQPAGAGCAADFAGFVAGRVALVRHRGCDPDSVVATATASGALAVVFTSPVRLTAPAAIPVVVAAQFPGAALVHLKVATRTVSGTDYNLVAESPHGDPAHVVVVDAHLDSIFGAGMLDNASGATTILETALALAHTPTRNRLRFVWFGGEELGLLGSKYYTTHLSTAERKRIAFDLDVDVTATPNFDIQVASASTAPNRAKFPPNVIPQSAPGDALFAAYFAAGGVVSRPAPFGNAGTDSNSFSLAGVPNTGILTEQDCCKAPWEVRLWGGFPGDYEGRVPGRSGGCVDRPGRWCDNLSNNDPFILELASKAAAFVTLKLADSAF